MTETATTSTGSTTTERMGHERIATWTARWHAGGACPCWWGEQHTGGHCCFAEAQPISDRWCHESDVDRIVGELPSA